MKLLQFPIIKLTVFIILGILIAFYFPVRTSTSWIITLVSFGLLILGVIYKPLGKSYWYGLIIFASITSIGILTHNLHDEKRWDSHYSHLYNSDNTNSLIVFQITKQLKPSAFQDKYEAQILHINGNKVTGKILVNITKDSIRNPILIDNIYLLNGGLSNIQKPKNPFQFNYADYLKRQHIYAQLYAARANLKPLNGGNKSLHFYAEQLRNRITTNLKRSQLTKNELSIIQALLLGQRQDISKDLYDNYAKAGVIHILAVSGLHVGIILLILQFLFRPLHKFKYGRHIAFLCIAISLWSFAIIAGLSPSVTRAVTMFTIVAIALNSRRFTNIYNTLAISAFLLLLWNPMYLFDVGFQLSYIAVLAIVSIQPVLYKLWIPKWYIPRKLWEVLTVTTAAQIGVLPLSLFYFHQFPGLFFLSNVVIIPFLGFILGLGLLVIILAYFNLLPDILAISFGWIISKLNSFISWVSEQESFLFTEISFGILQVITSYLILLSVFNLYKQRTFKTITYTLTTLLLFQLSYMYCDSSSKREQLIIFNKIRASLIGYQSNSKLNVYSNLEHIGNDYIIDNYKVGSRIKAIELDSLRSVILFKDKKLLVVDSLGVYNIKSFKPDYVLLRDSPKINLERLIDSIKPTKIIADASNFKSYVELWKITCLNKKIPFHSTYEKGAFILSD